MTPQDLADTHAAAFTQSRPWSVGEFADLLSNRFTHVVGHAQSFALFKVVADEAELLTIATHPSVQRQGLARQCMWSWHAKAKSLGATRAFLDVAESNHPAIALYERCGYTPCGVRKNYYAIEKYRKTDAIIMELSLI
ncbi:GNAT family N-acetyltransferase [Ruegeria lacuscaerulensis]|uniref:GNAT family N-acetyltransferase n=1 Tax=Ruegeria lacuscaerulensis TaxID=55218 RepID=UPI00147B5FCB|nr:GNAT family N-acetyltransferase [Ruegeria lacuscaerulensis]